MHAGNTITRPDQTTCSLIGLLDKAHLEEEQVGKGIHKYRDLFLTTGASNPCLTPYFPIFTDKTDLPKEYRKGGKKFNPESYWWKLEKIHRKAIFSYKKAKEKLEVDLQKYERSLLEFLNKKISNNQQITQKEIDQKFQKALTLSTDWWNKIKGFKTDVKWITGFIFRRFWENYNKRNSIHFR